MVGGRGKSCTHKKGTGVTRIPHVAHKDRKWTQSKNIKIVRSVIHEVAGLAPYERHAIEMLKLDNDKGCVHFLKRRLGNLKRAQGKQSQLEPHARA